jgi:hypothetical protein
MERPINDLTGRRFGKWTVLPRDDRECDAASRQWLVQCDCGNLRLVFGQDLLNGRSRSCGCAVPREETDDKKTVAHALRKRLQLVFKEIQPGTLERRAKSEGVLHT